MATKLQDVITFIRLDMSIEDRSKIIDVLNEVTHHMQRQACAAWRVGDHVQFFSTKRNRTVTGRVAKTNRKTVIVYEDGSMMKWYVGPSLLKKIA